MRIPVYVVTGFLGAGKTTFINTLMNNREIRDTQILLLQFEAGEEEFQSEARSCANLNFPKKMLEQDTQNIIHQIHGLLCEHILDEIWVEWNGVTPFAQLQNLFLHPLLRRFCRIEKVIHMTDAETIEALLGRTGAALPEQMASCDFAVVRGIASDQDFRRVRQLVRGLNPGAQVYETDETDAICSRINTKKQHPAYAFFSKFFWLAAFYLIVSQVLALTQMPLNMVINVFLGTILQAVPFLLIVVLVSSFIQVFVPREVIERRFPKKLGWGMLAAVLGGFCLPVCDCASVPIFRSLVRKGVPLPAAITFAAATPIINPVVILSTYYAFNGNLRIVAARVGLGVITAVLTGLIFAVFPPRDGVLTGGAGGMLCSCGCYDGADQVSTVRGKISLFIRHSQAEFFSVGKYLMIGALVASVFQVTFTRTIALQSGSGRFVSLLLLMALAFLLSLCSSSDAVIARGFASRFPMEAVMGFMVFGPIMDIKNVIMLSGGFAKRFIWKYLAAAFVVCYIVVFLLARVFLG